jgi:hypothetical protein
MADNAPLPRFPKFEPGDRVQTLAGNLNGTVEWTDGSDVGVRFDVAGSAPGPDRRKRAVAWSAYLLVALPDNAGDAGSRS